MKVDSGHMRDGLQYPEAPLSLFAGFDEVAMALVLEHLRQEVLPAHHVVFEDNTPGDTIYIVKSGRVQVSKTLENGQESVFAELGPGEFFGEMSLLVGGPRSASVFATSETEVLRLKSSDLFEVMKQYPHLESVLEQFYENRSKATRQKMRELRK